MFIAFEKPIRTESLNTWDKSSRMNFPSSKIVIIGEISSSDVENNEEIDDF